MVENEMKKYKNTVMNTLRRLRLVVIFLCSKNRIMGRLFYMFEASFDREFEYTLRGRYESLTSRYAHDVSNANIRRCVHRLEKGLYHRDRKLKFGVDVFNELSKEIMTLNNRSLIDKNELIWATNTLISYRQHATDQSSVDLAISRLQSHLSEIEIGEVPDPIGSLVQPSADFLVLQDLFKARKSVRFFDGRSVPVDLIKNAVEIAKEAPSACNRQPFSLYVLDKRGDIDFIGGLAPGTKGFLHNIPMLCVLVGHASSFRFTRDRHLIYTDSGIFLGHLLPALTSLGLSSCVLNWIPDWHNDRMAIEYLGVDLSKSVVCLLAIGYGDGTPSPTSIKKSNTNLLRFHNG